MGKQSAYDTNPYASPATNAVGIAEGAADAPRFRLVAVVLGAVVDIVGSTILATVLAFTFAAVLISRGTPLDGLPKALSDSLPLQIVSHLIGFAGTVLGGYVAAWIARHREVWHAFWTGVVSLAVGSMSLLAAAVSPLPRTGPGTIAVLGVLLTVPAAMFGGWLRRRYVRRR